uniref:Large ribosomal subunit protein mL53 n=1 Tax=Opuntia streptacantha TaxID=393608 RepID=A0A7C9CZ61_OPUST
MLRFLSKVKLEYNALDARAAACKEFLAQCISKDSNSPCQLQLKYRTDDHPPQINVTFINGVEEAFDASTTSAQTIRSLILRKGQYLESEQMFRDAGEAWPVVIPDEELQLPAPVIKPRKAEEKKQ